MNIDTSVLFPAIDQMEEFRGAGIAYVGDGKCAILRRSRHTTGIQTYVVIEETNATVASGPSPMPSSAPAASPATDRHVGRELLDLGLNCGGAVLSGLVISGEAAATPFTAGASGVLLLLTVSAASATAAQCGLSIGRVINVVTDPDANDILDGNEWYARTTQILDGIALLGAVSDVGEAAQWAMRAKRASTRPFTEILQGMTRAERKRLAKDLANFAAKTSRERELTQLARAGKFSTIFSAERVASVLKRELTRAVSASLTTSGSLHSGVLHSVLVHVLQQ